MSDAAPPIEPVGLATALCDLRLGRYSIALGVLWLVPAVAALILSACGGGFDAMLLRVFGLALLWLLLTSVALLVALRMVGDDRQYPLAVAMVYICLCSVFALGVAAVVGAGCAAANWTGSIGIPFVPTKVPIGLCVVVAAWTCTFACVVTLLSQRPWADLPRIAVLPVGVSLLCICSLVAQSLPARAELDAARTRASEGVVLARAIYAYHARFSRWPDRLAALADARVQRIGQRWRYRRTSTGWSIESVLSGDLGGTVHHVCEPGVGGEWHWVIGYRKFVLHL